MTLGELTKLKSDYIRACKTLNELRRAYADLAELQSPESASELTKVVFSGTIYAEMQRLSPHIAKQSEVVNLLGDELENALQYIKNGGRIYA